MGKDIKNFFEWCEDREKSTAILCKMSDDEIRESELYDEYRGHLMLLRDYFRIAGDDYVDDKYRDLNTDDDIFKPTLFDDLVIYAGIFLVFWAGLLFSGALD